MKLIHWLFGRVNHYGVRQCKGNSCTGFWNVSGSLCSPMFCEPLTCTFTCAGYVTNGYPEGETGHVDLPIGSFTFITGKFLVFMPYSCNTWISVLSGLAVIIFLKQKVLRCSWINLLSHFVTWISKLECLKWFKDNSFRRYLVLHKIIRKKRK